MTFQQQTQLAERINTLNAHRTKNGQPKLTQAEIADLEAEVQSTYKDTAQADSNLSQIGSVKRDKRGVKVMDGPYKGMSPSAAQQAAVSGAAPPSVKRGFSGLDALYKDNPHIRPTARPQGAAPPFFSGTTAKPVVPTVAPAPGPAGVASAATTAVNTAAAEEANAKANAGIARAMQDSKLGVHQRGENSVVWKNGAHASTSPTGQTTLRTPYGTGSSVKPASAAPPQVAAAQQRTSASVPVQPPPISKAAPPRLASPGLPALTSVIADTVVPVANDRQRQVSSLMQDGPPTPGASRVISGILAGQSSQTAPAPAPAIASAAPPSVRPQPSAQERVANVITQHAGPIREVTPDKMTPMPAASAAPTAAPSFDPRFAQAQRNLDVAAATPGLVGIGKGLATVGADVAKAAGEGATKALSSLNTVSNSVGGLMEKAATGVGNFVFGDEAAKKRLKNPSAAPDFNYRPPAVVTR